MDVHEYEKVIWDLKQEHKRELCYVTSRLRHAAREQLDRDTRQFLIFGFVLGAVIGTAAGAYIA